MGLTYSIEEVKVSPHQTRHRYLVHKQIRESNFKLKRTDNSHIFYPDRRRKLRKLRKKNR